jgi:hypothetical protein
MRIVSVTSSNPGIVMLTRRNHQGNLNFQNPALQSAFPYHPQWIGKRIRVG